MRYIFIKRGKAKDVFRALALMALADRLLKAKYGKLLDTVNVKERTN